MRSGIAKFKQMRHFATLTCLSVLLLGCASGQTRKPSAEASSKSDLRQMTVETPDADHDVAALLMQAQFALDKGDLEKAQEGYAKASMLSSDPQVAERAVGLALALHDSAAANKALKRWKVLGADRMGLLRARAQIALDEGRTDDARDLLMQLTAKGEKRSWQIFGKVVLGARDAAQAGVLLEHVAAPERLPDDVTAWLAMSQLGQKLGRYAYAQRIADLAAKRFRTGDAYAWAANMHAQRGDEKTARVMYARAVAAAPDDIELRLAYAGLLAKGGQAAAAEKMLAKGPQDERVYAARAAFAARAKDMHALRRVYDQLRHAPEKIRSRSYYLLGQLASLVDKPQAAVDWLAKVPAAGKHGLDAGIRRAVLLQELGRSSQAHAQVDSLLADFSTQPKVVRRLERVDAELYMRDGDYRNAIAAYTHALDGASDTSDLLYGRGLAYAEVGNIDAAIADFRAVLKQSPDDMNAVNALGYTLADAGRNLDEARKLLARAYTAQPDDPSIIDSWGWLQFRLGHLDEAEKALRLSWKKRKDPDVGAHLVQVLLARDKRSEAASIYRMALKLDPHNRHLRALKGTLRP